MGNSLAKKIEENRAVIGVIGLGYVGLPSTGQDFRSSASMWISEKLTHSIAAKIICSIWANRLCPT